MIKFISAGESHGKCLTGIISGLPSGLKIDLPFIENELKLRRTSSGRSERQKIESDDFVITSGLYRGATTGAPLAFTIYNEDYREEEPKTDYVPRPGHADFTGAVKYDLPPEIAAERASARSTAVTVAAGAILRCLLSEVGIICSGHVIQIGHIKAYPVKTEVMLYNSVVDVCSVRCADISFAAKLEKEIERARENGDSVGGKVEVDIFGLPVGIGSYVQPWDRLDAKLAGALMAIPSVKAVEIGLGTRFAEKYGSQCLDEFGLKDDKIIRESNNCGGIEGGISNGNTITAFITVKPIPTIRRSVDSIDLLTKKAAAPLYKRSDVCAAPAATVIARNVAAITIAEELSSELGGSTLEQFKQRFKEIKSL